MYEHVGYIQRNERRSIKTNKRKSNYKQTITRPGKRVMNNIKTWAPAAVAG
jgi:hypothetical protein